MSKPNQFDPPATFALFMALLIGSWLVVGVLGYIAWLIIGTTLEGLF